MYHRFILTLIFRESLTRPNELVYTEYTRFNAFRNVQVYMQGTARCVKDSLLVGNTPMVAFNYTNVNDTKEQLKKLKEREFQSQSQSFAKTRLLAHASHELRNPLNGILGLTRTILDGNTSNMTEEQVHNLDIIEQCGEELLRHVENLLVMSKIESNVLPVRSDPVDVRNVVHDVVDMIEARKGTVERQGRAWNVSIESVIANDVAQIVLGDAGHIKSILANLVSNAFKATIEGSVTITVKRSPPIVPDTTVTQESTYDSQFTSPIQGSIPSSPEYQQSAGQDWLEFRVIDTGVGIASDLIGTLFRAYSQIESTYVRNYQGTGLGLSISKSLVHAMGGRIGAKSEVGKGSEFWFVIPAPLPTKQPPSPSRLTKPLASTKLKLAVKCPLERILCAEDNSINMKVLTGFLKQLGYTNVDTAEDGLDAWNMIEAKCKSKEPYQLILSDISMPRMTGKDLIDNIRQQCKTAQPFIVVISASSLQQEVVKNMEAPADLFLMKPLRKEVLENVMEQAWAFGRGT